MASLRVRIPRFPSNVSTYSAYSLGWRSDLMDLRLGQGTRRADCACVVRPSLFSVKHPFENSSLLSGDEQE